MTGIFSVQTLFDEISIQTLLEDEQEYVALLLPIQGRIRMLGASEAFRDAFSVATDVGFLETIFGDQLMRQIHENLVEQESLRVSLWCQQSKNHPALKEFWWEIRMIPFKGIGILKFIRLTPQFAYLNQEESLQMSEDVCFSTSRPISIKTSLQGTIQEANRNFATLLESNQMSLVGESLKHWVSPLESILYESILNRCSINDVPIRCGLTLKVPMGEPKPIYFTVAKVSGELIWIGTEESNQHEQELRQAESRFRTILDNIEDAFFSVDDNWMMTYINKKGSQLLDLDGKILPASPDIWTILPYELNAPLKKLLHRAKALQQPVQQEMEFNSGWFSVRAYPGNAELSVFIADITAIKLSEVRAKRKALQDVLTGLPNREAFSQQLALSIAHARKLDKRLAVMFIDLDGFKSVNDTLGHDTGDILLQMVATRLKSCVRSNDVVARQSGDEFLVLLSDIPDMEVAKKVGQKIVQALSEFPFTVPNGKVHIGASLGCAIYPEHGANVQTLMKNADLSMYYIKQSGKNAVALYDDKLTAQAEKRFQMEQNIRLALDSKGLVAHYQPRFDARTREITGFESLARMKLPDGRLIAPMDFIPVAEETDLICQIGQVMLAQACSFLCKLDSLGHGPYNISVNVSAKQIKKLNLHEVVAETLKQFNLCGSRLELEVTESVFLSDTPAIREQFEKLTKLGVKLALDDFGTGYSCLAYIRAMNVSTIKLDRSFVSPLPGNEESAMLVQAMIAMSKALKVSSVAEGVETAEQADFLTENGVTEMQGYGLAIPMGDEDVLRFIEKHKVKQEAAGIAPAS